MAAAEAARSAIRALADGLLQQPAEESFLAQLESSFREEELSDTNTCDDAEGSKPKTLDLIAAERPRDDTFDFLSLTSDIGASVLEFIPIRQVCNLKRVSRRFGDVARKSLGRARTVRVAPAESSGESRQTVDWSWQREVVFPPDARTCPRAVAFYQAIPMRDIWLNPQDSSAIIPLSYLSTPNPFLEVMRLEKVTDTSLRLHLQHFPSLKVLRLENSLFARLDFAAVPQCCPMLEEFAFYSATRGGAEIENDLGDAGVSAPFGRLRHLRRFIWGDMVPQAHLGALLGNLPPQLTTLMLDSVAPYDMSCIAAVARRLPELEDFALPFRLNELAAHNMLDWFKNLTCVSSIYVDQLATFPNVLPNIKDVVMKTKNHRIGGLARAAPSAEALARADELLRLALAKIPNCTALTLAVPRLPAAGCPALARLTRLELVHVDLTSAFSAWVGASPKLKELKLAQCLNDTGRHFFDAVVRSPIERLLLLPRRTAAAPIAPREVEALLAHKKIKYLFIDVGRRENLLRFSEVFDAPRANPEERFHFADCSRVANGTAFAQSFNDNGRTYHMPSSYEAWRCWDMIGP